MLLGGVFWHQHGKYQSYWLAVGRFKRDAFLCTNKYGNGIPQIFYTSMRNGNLKAQTSGTEFFSCEKRIKHAGPCNPVFIFEHQANLFKEAFLAG